MRDSPPPKILICTKQDLPGALILNHILPKLTGYQVKVFLSDKTRDAELVIPELAMLKYLERELPIGLVFPLIDALPTAEGAEKLTFRGLSQRFGVSCQVVDDVNSPHWLKVMCEFAPDITLSVRFSNIFKADSITIAKVGTFNLHPGALPQYAGLFPSFRAMLNRDTQTGGTLHRVDRRIDGGPILGIGWTDLRAEEGLLCHVFKSYYAGLDLFMDVLPSLIEGKPLPETQQDRSLRTYRSLPTEAQIRDFLDQGHLLFNPTSYAQTLQAFVPDGLGLPVRL